MFLQSHREDLYPNLRAHGYEVTSEQTLFKKVRYNCVAWAAIGDVGKWWQAGISPDFFWPVGVLDDGSFQSYIELFEWLGYERTQNRRRELFYEKIALFESSAGDFEHVSYQLFYGWTSKLGGWEDIWHRTLEAMEEGDYGNAKVIMKRRSKLRGFLARAWFLPTAKWWPIQRDQLSNAKK
jgi:hypothetical protein